MTKKDNKKGIPEQPWEIKYDQNRKKITPATAFDPHKSKDRPCTHLKINPEDH